jgi:hypothetical protein
MHTEIRRLEKRKAVLLEDLGAIQDALADVNGQIERLLAIAGEPKKDAESETPPA